MINKKDTAKIKTNPKYKCVDDGSDDGDVDEKQHEDYQQLSSKEIDFRETIIKQESKPIHWINQHVLMYREAVEEGEEVERERDEEVEGPQRGRGRH